MSRKLSSLCHASKITNICAFLAGFASELCDSRLHESSAGTDRQTCPADSPDRFPLQSPPQLPPSQEADQEVMYLKG